MSSADDFAWRDRAAALACLGAASLSRVAFTPVAAADPQPLQMQVLVALALQDSLAADRPRRTGTTWLSRALRVEQPVIHEIVRGLERARLLSRTRDASDELLHELDDDAEAIAGELPIILTDLGREQVDRWLARARLHFGGWPPQSMTP